MRMAEGVGFEPTVGGHPTTVFKTVAIGHSATLPPVALFSLHYISQTCRTRNVVFPLLEDLSNILWQHLSHSLRRNRF